MIVADAANIREVVPFPTLKPRSDTDRGDPAPT
jgi:hypothetical protein